VVIHEFEAPAADAPRPTFGERLRSPAGKLALRVTVVVLVITVLLLIFGIWWPIVSLPTSASDTQDAVQLTIIVFSIAAAPVMAVVWGIAYYSLRHWRHTGDTPPEDGPPIRGNNKVVTGWLVISAVLTAFLLVWGLSELSSTTTIPSSASPLIVKVTGQQWLWSFSYPQDGNISSSDLMLPLNRPVIFQVTSTDVIHSFWLPEMGVKVDANPEITTQTNTTPTLLGTFNVRCAELCGLNHSYMETIAKVMSPADFNSWVISQGGVPGQNLTAEGSNG
jgi:cytochrome c oxidase subunit 2